MKTFILGLSCLILMNDASAIVQDGSFKISVRDARLRQEIKNAEMTVVLTSKVLNRRCYNNRYTSLDMNYVVRFPVDLSMDNDGVRYDDILQTIDAANECEFRLDFIGVNFKKDGPGWMKYEFLHEDRHQPNLRLTTNGQAKCSVLAPKETICIGTGNIRPRDHVEIELIRK